ncbi:cysteine hydrolase family protein [Ascidiimonas sp. W6]|uniref:cysteine hydrolase family protein n=1 Tax=Ascidiimonas meishanensis TaxID=3128903 RepID=UPI0030EEF018
MIFERTALLVVDVQKGFEEQGYWGEERNNLDAEKKIAQILHYWRTAKLPVYIIKHCSTNKASPLHKSNFGNALQDFVNPQPGESIIEKEVNSAFIGTNLEEQLKEQRIHTLIIVGLTTDHCISTTTRMAGNLGFHTLLIEDATATYNKKGIDGTNYPAKLMHDTAIASLKDEFAVVLGTEELLKQLGAVDSC